MNSKTAASVHRGKAGKWITIIVGLGIVLAIVVSWTTTMQNPANSHSSSRVPKNLGEMELIGEVTGEKAIAEIDKLHGTGIEIADGYIAQYGHSRSRVIVWVAVAASETDASGLLKQMVERIKDGTGNQPFRNLRSVSVGGKQVFTVDGPGGDNFFYASDAKVVWLALQIQGGDPIGVVKTSLKIF